MSIASVTKKLREGAGPLYTINQVKLGYQNGGKQQVLTFLLSCNQPGHKLTEVLKVYTMDGGANPVERAYEIGRDLAENLKNSDLKDKDKNLKDK